MITTDTIMSWGPCDRYDAEHVEQLRKSVCGRRKSITVDDVLSADIPLEDKLWTVLRPEFIPERELHMIAIFCWEKIARPICEKDYPNDKRPHEAVRIKKLWINGKATDEELAAASDAARAAAWDSARAAAWDSARAAARAAAWDSAWDSAGAAARAAAWAAAWDSARAAAWDSARAAARAAAWDSAWDSAGAAARAAAWDSARAAAWDSARDSAGAAALNKIIKYIKQQTRRRRAS